MVPYRIIIDNESSVFDGILRPYGEELTKREIMKILDISEPTLIKLKKDGD